MKDKIVEMIENNKEVFECAFIGRFPTDKELNDAENLLGVKIPEEYVWFLKTYGGGGGCCDYLGYTLNGKAIFAEETQKYRKYGLPQHLLVIANCDEFIYCIDTITNEIVSWSMFDNNGIIKVADNFYTHFLDNINNTIENFN